jgi:putative hydrolase of the HAD superfamily
MTLDAVFFDLDYTLYDQSQHVRGALADVADVIARDADADRAALGRSLLQVWCSAGSRHDRLFDLWLARHGLWSRARVERSVEAFHEHRPRALRLYAGAHEVLAQLKATCHVGIVTDGHVGMQRMKVEALGVADQVHTIVYSAALSRRKPDPDVFHHALHEAGVAPETAAFVGDHPVCDVVGARQVGMRAIRMLAGEFQRLPDHPGMPPHGRVRTLRELPSMLAHGGLADMAAVLSTVDGVS